MGSYFGASLDTYQFFLKRPVRNRILVFIYDLLFWLTQALLIFYVLFLVNEGELRFYLFLALLCGFSAYQALFKTGYMATLRMVIRIVIAILIFFRNLVNNLVIRPIKWLVSVIYFLLRNIVIGLFSLLKLIIKLSLWAIKVISAPLVWIIRQIYNMFPDYLTSKLEKIYNLCRGFFGNIQNTIFKLLKKWKNEE
ncbi:MAG: spore cortex biosynthesis protein YabQ [Bacillus sp. (in: firmicutes)]